jgi:Holliday junction resolvase-like predicted endonuclease
MDKGRQNERYVAELYQSNGYETYIPPKAKYREQDVFGVFDILGSNGDRLECVQVKTNRARGIIEWFAEARPYAQAHTDVRITFVVVHDGQDVRIARSDCEGYEWVYDGRAEDGPKISEVLA